MLISVQMAVDKRMYLCVRSYYFSLHAPIVLLTADDFSSPSRLSMGDNEVTPDKGRFSRFCRQDNFVLPTYEVQLSYPVGRERYRLNELRINFISENCNGLWTLVKGGNDHNYNISFVFEKESDALLFKMRFSE